MKDCVVAVVGGGPAGLCAAGQLQRMGVCTVLLEKHRLGGAVRLAHRLDNCPTMPHGTSGEEAAELLARFALSAELPIRAGEVRRIAYMEGRFHLYGNTELRAKAVVLATGLRDKVLKLPPSLHPFLWTSHEIPQASGRVLIVGGGDVAFDRALSWRKAGWDVTLFHRSAILRALPSLVQEATRLGVHRCQGRIEDLRLSASGFSIPDGMETFQRLVIHIGREPDVPEITADGERFIPVAAGPDGECRIKGLFLAGDLRHPEQRMLSLALGDGMAAALACQRFLSDP